MCTVITFLRKQTSPPVWNVSGSCEASQRRRPRVKGQCPLFRRAARCCFHSQPPPLPSDHSNERREHRENDHRKKDLTHSFRKARRLKPSDGAAQGTLALKEFPSWSGGAIRKNQGACYGTGREASHRQARPHGATECVTTVQKSLPNTRSLRTRELDSCPNLSFGAPLPIFPEGLYLSPRRFHSQRGPRAETVPVKCSQVASIS